MLQVVIGNKVIGDGQPAYVIAEMAWAHDGSLENARKMILGASKAGADAVSVHITNLSAYMVKDYGRSAKETLAVGQIQEDVYDYLERINITEAAWSELFTYAKNLGLAVCAMPNDFSSLALCKTLDPDCYVIAASCFVEENFVSEIAAQKKPLVLRIGGATMGEIERVINLAMSQGALDIILLHGIQLYPTKIEDTHLNLIPSLKKIFGLPVGLADHIDGDSPLAFAIPLASLGIGANVIEKHITYDRSAKGEDYISALNEDELKSLVVQIREVEKALGVSSFRPLSEGELRYRRVSRKRMVAARNITGGERISEPDFSFKRANDGAYPDQMKVIVGRSSAYNIGKDEPITIDKVI